MDEEKQQMNGSVLEGRLSRLEALVQQQSENNAEMIRGLNARMEQLLEIFQANMATQTGGRQPQVVQTTEGQPHDVHTGERQTQMDRTSGGDPDKANSQRSLDETQEPRRPESCLSSQKPSQSVAMDAGGTGGNSRLPVAPGLRHSDEQAWNSTALSGVRLSDPSQSCPPMRPAASSAPTRSAAPAWPAYDCPEDDVISNTPVKDSETARSDLSSLSNARHGEFDNSLDIHDSELFASHLCPRENEQSAGVACHEETPARERTPGGLARSPPLNEDWISNSPVSAAAPDVDKDPGRREGAPGGPTALARQEAGSSCASLGRPVVEDLSFRTADLFPAPPCPPFAPAVSTGVCTQGLPRADGSAQAEPSEVRETTPVMSPERCATGGLPGYQYRGKSPAGTYPHERQQVQNAMFAGNGSPSSDQNDLDAAADKMLVNLRVSGDSVLKEAVMRAFREERPSPRATTAQTVLCLDCSPSLGPQGLALLKQAALNFVTGIEQVAEQHGLDENLGVVTFGASTEVVQHLTVDYEAVKAAIESVSLAGRSPLFEAILVSVAAFKDRGGALSIARVHVVRPRILVFTDGIATQTDSSEGPENFDITPSHRRIALIQLLNVLYSHSSTPCPIVWVPVGKADKDFLMNLAKIGKGKYVEPENICQECHHYHFQDVLAKAYLCVQDYNPENYDDEGLSALVDAIYGDTTGIDKTELLTALREKLRKKDTKHLDPNDFHRLLERPELPPLGTRVVRGSGWRWQDQDGGGVGTIICHCARDEEWLYVLWDHGKHNRYHFLPEGRGDVTLANSPRYLQPGGTIAVGVRVKRGPDWNQGDEDGGPSSIGVVVRVRDDGKIRVRWPSGEFGKYKWRIDGKMYLDLVDIEEDTLSKQVYQETCTTAPQDSADDLESKRKVVVWQWSPLGNEDEWTNYDEATGTRLENQYRSRPCSTCVIEREGHRRVSFQKMEEWMIDSHASRNRVRRILEDAAE